MPWDRSYLFLPVSDSIALHTALLNNKIPELPFYLSFLIFKYCPITSFVAIIANVLITESIIFWVVKPVVL
jgi:hypothetical protein